MDARDARIHELLRRHGWQAATAADPAGWSPANPSFGQCAVTALLLNEIAGLEIRRVEAIHPDGTRESHYFNLLDGAPLDPTAAQVPPGSRIPDATGAPRTRGFASTRAYLLSNPDTRARYQRLRAAADRAALAALLIPATA